ncbi:MAG: polysaccharide deacetylase [Pseudomonadota bacterium]
MKNGSGTRWVAPLDAPLSGAARPVRFFFRDDDAGRDGPALLRLVDLFARAGVPLDLAVIPAAIDTSLADNLCRRCEASGGSLRLHQHGWRHDNHEPTGRKCEFGPSRPVGEKRADIERGRETLAEMFGAFVDPIFTPPWNRCDVGTVALLAESGFRVLSRDRTARPLPMHGLAELPVSVDWIACERAGTLSDRLGEAVTSSGAADAPVGVMLHHAEMEEEGRTRVTDLLALLRRHSGARCLSMMDCVTGN